MRPWPLIRVRNSWNSLGARATRRPEGVFQGACVQVELEGAKAAHLTAGYSFLALVAP